MPMQIIDIPTVPTKTRFQTDGPTDIINAVMALPPNRAGLFEFETELLAKRRGKSVSSQARQIGVSLWVSVEGSSLRVWKREPEPIRQPLRRMVAQQEEGPRFSLDIDLDAMTMDHVAAALRRVANQLDSDGLKNGIITDQEGNTVGQWEVLEGRPV